MNRKSTESSTKVRDIAAAVRGIELSQTAAWSDLDMLSSNTHIEAIEVFEDEIRADGARFVGPINVHVTLQYPEDVTLSETFPGRFEATWKDNQPSIDKLEVDTSSFYS
jgi:Predicted pPIWI-associating nuclease